ncbi:MAG: universal stress protein [Desulfomonile tiedjei]|nr:universal stress protein [Desulfomonile tiedjei]
MYKKILIPLDGSKNDEVVIEHVKTLALEFKSSLTLILVYRLAKADDPFERQMQMEDGSSGYRARLRAEAYLPKLEESLRRQGVEVVTEFLIVEEPEAQAIVRYAREKDFDLIALTNRERSPIGNFFFGNIEEKVRRRSTIPVLFVSEGRSQEERS